MKSRRNRFEQEAWIMALIVPAIVVIGIVAGMLMPWISRLFSFHPH